jgi:large subunit ribosomal protein L10
MVTKNQKEETITELKNKLSKAVAVYATTQKGLTVAEITSLRKNLRASNAEYKIAKNSLVNIASKGTNYEQLSAELKGPSAIVICYQDGVAPLGAVKKFSDENNEKVAINSGVLEGEFLDRTKANKVAGLPSKDVLLSQIAGMLVQPMSSVAYILKELGEKEEKNKLLKEFIVAADAS